MLPRGPPQRTEGVLPLTGLLLVHRLAKALPLTDPRLVHRRPLSWCLPRQYHHEHLRLQYLELKCRRPGAWPTRLLPKEPWVGRPVPPPQPPLAEKRRTWRCG
uniref:Secreted protein n=1 Tax=Peronospora matthiolae TaxID=2874970 RepID=A0AAV1U0D4_9STRA